MEQDNTKEKVVNTEQDSGSIFTKQVDPIPPVKYFFLSLGEGLWKCLRWILDLIATIFLSIGAFTWMVIKGIGKGAVAIYNYFKRKCHQFKYNDWAGRTSYILFGTSSFKHGQIVNGIMYILFEVAYITLFAIFGVPALADLPDLGNVVRVCKPVYNEDLGITLEECHATGNSILILITGLLWCVSILLFLYIWHRSIESGYSLYRIENYLDFEKVTKQTLDYSNKLSDEAVDAYNSKISHHSFKQSKRDEINEYLNAFEEGKIRDYAKYILDGTIANAYAHARKHAKLEKKVAHLERKREKLVASRKKSLDLLINKEVVEEKRLEHEAKVDKHKNATLSKVSALDDKLKKAKHKVFEEAKTYSCYSDRQNTINHDKYGKYNFFFKNVAKIDNELVFWNNYQTFVNTYNENLGGNVTQNEANKNKIVEIKASLKEKIAKTNEKFAIMVEKRKAVEAEIEKAKEENKKLVESINAENAPDKEQKLLDAKADIVAKCTRLNRQLNDLPSLKMIKSMKNEEIKESKHAATRDVKYLKTNFTPETYANQCVMDKMLIDYDVEYANAITFSNMLFDKSQGKDAFYTQEYVSNKIIELKEARDTYTQAHPDKYVGKPKTFIQQIKGLFNENFHVTILFLPLLGILLFSIIPLIFSILVAFTNYSAGHKPPTDGFQWIGFQNFITLFSPSSQEFKDLPAALGLTLSWTMIWAVCATFSNYFLGIIVALMINKDGIKFKKLWRTIFVITIAIPQFISLLSIAELLKDTGAVGKLFFDVFNVQLGFGKAGHIAATKLLIVLVNIWVGIPYTILSTTGILLNIPKDLYESSKVDGAGAVTQFLKITMPYILFVTGPYLITQFVGNINNFNVIFFLTGGGPQLPGSSLGVGQTDLMITFLYDLITSGTNPQFGIASTIGIVIFAVCAFFSIIMYNKTGSIQEEDQFQ